MKHPKRPRERDFRLARGPLAVERRWTSFPVSRFLAFTYQ
jgi:hypothetical protein